tara:strand:- start:3056 stop:3568 length:513 start_codon:yes stop_codon:yes gene_type:complete
MKGGGRNRNKAFRRARKRKQRSREAGGGATATNPLAVDTGAETHVYNRASGQVSTSASEQTEISEEVKQILAGPGDMEEKMAAIVDLQNKQFADLYDQLPTSDIVKHFSSEYKSAYKIELKKDPRVKKLLTDIEALKLEGLDRPEVQDKYNTLISQLENMYPGSTSALDL